MRALQQDGGYPIPELRVDGGMVKNDTLMQMQADILGIPVVRPRITETTALGAAYLAGLGVGMWRDTDEIGHQWEVDRRFEPKMSDDEREFGLKKWSDAVARVKS